MEASNVQKMREALLFVKQYFDKIAPFNPNTYTFAQIEVDHIQDAISAALVAPPRNCDKYATENDARDAWFAEEVRPRIADKPMDHAEIPFPDWLFAPATEEGGAQ